MILLGHTSQETAFVVEDYPYGFRLRCKMRIWIEFKPRLGERYCTQTTNPKKATEYWNKPKCGTYHDFAFLNQLENGHIESRVLHISGEQSCFEAFNLFKEIGLDRLPEEHKKRLRTIFLRDMVITRYYDLQKCETDEQKERYNSWFEHVKNHVTSCDFAVLDQMPPNPVKNVAA